MAKITASLSRIVDARGKSEILLRFVAGRDHIYRLHSRLWVAPSRWKDGAVVIPRLATDEQRELIEVKNRLQGLVSALLEAFGEADREAVDKRWMQETVERYHHPDRAADRRLIPMFSEFRALRNVSPARDKRYGTVQGCLERYEAYRGRSLTVGCVNEAILGDFRQFLEDEYLLAGKRRWRTLYKGMDRPPERRSRNCIVDYMKVLRAFFNWLEKKGAIGRSPFRDFEIGSAAYGTPYYITIEERERVYRTDLRRHPALAAQRDIFVFQCLVGCRVGDLLALKKGDVVDGVLVYMPRKGIRENPKTVRVPLTETAQEIVGRYKDFRGEKLLPFISTQKYNDAIKRIFLAARLTRPVSVLDPVTLQEEKRPLNEVASSHLARRTFVGNLYKQVKDQSIVSAMSGHEEGSRAFSRYRDIDDEIKTDIVELLEKKPDNA